MTTTEFATSTKVKVDRSGFYLWTSAAMLAVAVIGFLPTFWIPLAQGVPERFPLYAIHGMLCYAWIALLIYQTWLARSGRVARHRDTGLVGVSLATALVIIGIMTAVSSARRAMAVGTPEGSEAFLIVTMGELICFTTFLVAALVNLKRPDWHKRLMIASSSALLPAAIARLFITGGHVPVLNGTVGLAGLPAAPLPPVGDDGLPFFMAGSFIVMGMLHDWRTRRSVHPAYLWAGGFNLAFELLKAPISGTALWHHIARGLLAVF